MNILVCIKQVPDTTEIKIDPVKNTLIREGVPSIVNPFDGYALEAAARIKDSNPDTKIVVLSMGPAQAKNALKECLGCGQSISPYRPGFRRLRYIGNQLHPFPGHPPCGNPGRQF